MKQEVKNSVDNTQVEHYQAPRMELIEIEIEDAVLSGTPSMPTVPF